MQLKDRKRIDHFSCSNVMRVKGGGGCNATAAQGASASASSEGSQRLKSGQLLSVALGRSLRGSSVSLSHASFLVPLETHLTFPSLPSPAPCPVILSSQYTSQCKDSTCCSSSCSHSAPAQRFAPSLVGRLGSFLVAFRSGCLDLLPRRIRLMWCALGARGSNPAPAPRAPIPDFV